MRYEGTLDTDTFIYFLEGRERFSKEFESLIRRANRKGTQFLVPLIVIVELVYLLENDYGIERHEIKETVEGMLTLPLEIESKELVLEALELYVNSNGNFGDALVRARARLSGAEPVISFGGKDE